MAAGDVEAGVAALGEARRMQSMVGHHLTIAVVSLDLADAYRHAGRLAEAVEHAGAARGVFAALGYADAAARCVPILAEAGGTAEPGHARTVLRPTE